jgi:predicted Zn-dependent protease
MLHKSTRRSFVATSVSAASLDGQDNTLPDLIKSVDRGLLVTRLWYIRVVQPKTWQLTGLTRDGVFLIENGKVTDPVTNFRWNESPARGAAAD